ncbi:MAG: hypothetical protein NVS4B1_01950 [Ktedonobacteraceae bacterium]
MQQDKQASTPSPSRLLSRSGSSLKPLLFLPFKKEDTQPDHRKEQGHNVPTYDPIEEASTLSIPLVRGEVLYRLPNTDASRGTAHRASDSNTPREGVPRLPETPRNKTTNPFELQHIHYDELDKQLEEELDFSRMSTVHLMQLSGMMRAISKPLPAVKVPSNRPHNVLTQPSFYSLHQDDLLEYVSTLPRIATISAVPAQVSVKPTPTWKVLLKHPISKLVFGLAIGVIILLLLSRLIDFKATTMVLEQHLTTPAGILHAGVGGVAFILAFTLRGVRWKLFLNRISDVSVFKAIRIYWIGVFINFLLPVQGGEVAKSIMLKKVANIPVSQSLPTVAMDKALDLMPVLVIIAITPLIPGIHMNMTLWLVMFLVASILAILMIIVALTWWKREIAIQLINFFLRLLPKSIGAQIEGFGMGFVDSLIEGLKRPRSFIPATLLTALAILCEGIFAWQESQAIGLNTMGLGIATFGYTIFTMFSILPTPPAQVGTSEGTKMIVFASLLGFNKNKVLAMSLLSHMLGILLISAISLAAIWSLGLTLDSILTMKRGHHEDI